MKPSRKKRFRLINVVGIDGAGKTTLARSLADQLGRTDQAVQYCYSQYFAKLLYPVKRLAQLLFMHNTDEFRNYEAYNRIKKTTSSRHPVLARTVPYKGHVGIIKTMKGIFGVTDCPTEAVLLKRLNALAKQ